MATRSNKAASFEQNAIKCFKQHILQGSPNDYIILLHFQNWFDSRLKWNDSEYDNITVIIVHASDIWTPVLAIENGYGF